MRNVDPKEWIRYARSDEKISNIAFSEGEYENACWSAQQSAEKWLKGTLLFYGLQIRKTHRLADLILSLMKVHQISVNSDLLLHCDYLTDVGIAARYPGLLITKEDAEKALLSSRVIVRFCEELMSKLPKSDSFS